MPVYDYICRYHLDEHHIAVHPISEHDAYTPPVCSRCGETMTRDYSTVQIAPVVIEYFSTAVGQAVTSHRQVESELARKQDEMSERLGFDQKYALADPKDTKHLRVTSEG